MSIPDGEWTYTSHHEFLCPKQTLRERRRERERERAREENETTWIDSLLSLPLLLELLTHSRLTPNGKKWSNGSVIEWLPVQHFIILKKKGHKTKSNTSKEPRILLRVFVSSQYKSKWSSLHFFKRILSLFSLSQKGKNNCRTKTTWIEKRAQKAPRNCSTQLSLVRVLFLRLNFTFCVPQQSFSLSLTA